MRLLNSESFEMKDFLMAPPPYAILSHTWGDEEVTFQDMQRTDRTAMKGYAKILNCCRQARRDGLDWVWVDTCCIDKTSSAELSEAINSMYRWYSKSEVCYVFLEDVPAANPDFPVADFKLARWFTRGWCLQELLAPAKIEFYAKDWSDIGTKQSLINQIEDITGIPRRALSGFSLKNFPIAERMSWASHRHTTRPEDMAYCLFGIFGINMPLLYGEGQNAFRRLQEELFRQSEDFSLLLWSALGGFRDSSLRRSDTVLSVLAPSPALFRKKGPHFSMTEKCDYREIKIFSQHTTTPSQKHAQWRPPQLTSRGLHVQMFIGTPPRANGPHSMAFWTGYLYKNKYVCIMIRQYPSEDVFSYGRDDPSRVSLLSLEDFKTLELSEIYLNTNGMTHSPRHGSLWAIERDPFRPDLEIIMSSKQNTTISFVESSPPILFYRLHGAEASITFDPPPDSQLYCPDIRSSAHPRLPARLKMKFKICKRVANTITNEYVVVHLGLDVGHPRCMLRASSDTDVLASNGADQEEGLEDDLEDCPEDENLSDRASLPMPDEYVVYIIAKGSQNPQPVASDPRRRKPASYTVQVSLLTRDHEALELPKT